MRVYELPSLIIERAQSGYTEEQVKRETEFTTLSSEAHIFIVALKDRLYWFIDMPVSGFVCLIIFTS